MRIGMNSDATTEAMPFNSRSALDGFVQSAAAVNSPRFSMNAYPAVRSHRAVANQTCDENAPLYQKIDHALADLFDQKSA